MVAKNEHSKGERDMKLADFSGKERCIVLGEFMVAHNATVRSAAQAFGISKSTVHKDVTLCLKGANNALYMEVRELLQKNKQERHLRGGEATRIKYSERHTET